MYYNPFTELFNKLTSHQKDEQLYLMKKEHEKFLWKQLDRTKNSIALNSIRKFSFETWYNFIYRIILNYV